MIRRRKLVLRAETVRAIGAIDLREVHGGMYQRTDVDDLCMSDEAGGCLPRTCTSGTSTADVSRTIPC